MLHYHSNYKILDALFHQIAIIDLDGRISFVNESWIHFAIMNNGDLGVGEVGSNYFEACNGHPDILEGIQCVLSGATPVYKNEYPCHSPTVNRWFLMQVTPILTASGEITGAVISHIDITERKELEIRLQKLAMTDSLSGLYNRRYFNLRLQEELAQAMECGGSLSLLCMDIDHFKRINDTYGHDAGDEAILQLSSILKRLTRQSDVCARLGGDEFVILLPGLSLDNLRELAELILLEVRNCRIKVNGDTEFFITVSIGAVEAKEMMHNKKTILQRADKALYQAKQAGRDCVFMTTI